MERRVSLKELIRNAGVTPIDSRQPCLPAPTQPVITASDEDHAQARNILLDRRSKNPENKNVLKSIFRSSKDKEKSQELGQFSQEELDQALSSVIRNPSTGPGIIQAFLILGAKVNVIETPDKKKKLGNNANSGVRRRSTVLQQAATLRRADSVSILASSGADQTTLDEGLKAALTSNDQACIQELLRHGADLSKFPNALANAVRSNDLNYVRLLLRAPKPLSTAVVSSCLPAAVQQTSDAIVSLLISYGADPNFDSSSALNTAIGKQDYKLAVTLVSGPIPLSQPTLQRLLDTTMRLPACEATIQFLQVLFCCGLPPSSIGLPDLLICTARKNDTIGAKMMVSYGVSTAINDAECLQLALMNSNWALVNAILETPISPQHAATALTVLPSNTPQPERLRIIHALVQKGAAGPPLTRWLTLAAKDGDTALVELLLSAGAPVGSRENGPLQYAIANRDKKSLTLLLNANPSPEALAMVFPLLRTNHSQSERLETSRLLLQAGARGPEVDQALVDAVADTSSTRDGALIRDLLRHGANVNYSNGKTISLAAAQADIDLLRLLCNSKVTSLSTSSALPLAFDSNGGRHLKTFPIIDLLLSAGVEEEPALRAMQIAINGGPDNLDIIKRLITANARLLSPAFQYTVALEDSKKKAPILASLLELGVSQDSLDQSLAVEIRHAVSNKDTTTTKLLLGEGASVSYNDGEALSVAVASGRSSLTEMLLSGKHQPSRSSLTKAFRSLFTDEHTTVSKKNEKSVYKIARELLVRGVEQLAIDSALRATLCGNFHGIQNLEPLVDLLLKHDANVNTADGACFVFAAQKQNHSLLEKLMHFNPKFNIIVPALLSAKLQDQIAVLSIKLCFEHGCTSEDLETGVRRTPVLILAMQEYPRNEALVKLLLDHGCNPDSSTTDTFDASIGEESVSALLWALHQNQKRISDQVVSALLEAGASVSRASPASEITPVALAAREGRYEIVQALLERGSDVSSRDKWNRSALFHASSASTTATVQALAPHALKNDGSLHEAARSLQLDAAAILIKYGHDPSFPSRLHGGRNALGELCLNAHVTNASQRSKVRKLIRILLDNGANPGFKARNEKSSVFHALDNAYSALDISEALLETEIWETLNNDTHLYRDSSGLWYSALAYVELIPSPNRAANRKQFLDLLRDKGCLPKYYSEAAIQPPGAIGIPAPIAKLVDAQKAHDLSLRHDKEKHEHDRTLEETTHRDLLRRKREAADAELAAQTTAQQHWQTLEQQKHDFEVHRVRAAEQMKRAEKAAWHALLMEQERDSAHRRASIEERKAGAALASEARMVEQRKAEVEHRAAVEKRMLKEKEDVYERNVGRQKGLMRAADESAQLHAKLRQERPAIEGAPQWGSVD